MIRKTLAIFFALTVFVMAAQNDVKVKYNGAKPTINDFATSFLATDNQNDEDCNDEAGGAMALAWSKYRKGLPLGKGNTITVDEKNGYIRYESKYEENTMVIEMCYWNEADKKHKLFAYNVNSYSNGKPSVGQFDGITFYRYNNATKKMEYVEGPGFDCLYDLENVVFRSFDLPRVGKDLTVNILYENGKKSKKIFRWNGTKFTF